MNVRMENADALLEGKRPATAVPGVATEALCPGAPTHGARPRRVDLAARACRNCPARSGGFCGNLPAHLLPRLSRLAAPATHTAEHWLWDLDGEGRFVTVVRAGYLRLLRYSSGGRRLVLGIAGPGAMVGEILPHRGRYGVECATDVTLCTFGRAALERLEHEDAGFRRTLHAERRRALGALQDHIWMRGLQTPEERLASFLSRATQMLPYQTLPDGGGVLTLEIPRADIADLVGTSRETISRITHRWQDEGLIAIPDGGHLVIRDPAQLARRGGLSPTRRRGPTTGRPVHLHYL
ncbi:Crp/Fnr family transcriptional regulator [Acidimangrovimonas sediminis]|uniref:Crp/Fnr family transcriptional regulator n=1 Tax=Acidimangrovimonas sediminis TaxID=2056283 RepID=UPI0013049BF9|nr:Crp/Fnr family transcriptional regulator [Acidimangrovimonas sediminis]